jgi:hypothetical protein
LTKRLFKAMPWCTTWQCRQQKEINENLSQNYSIVHLRQLYWNRHKRWLKALQDLVWADQTIYQTLFWRDNEAFFII